MNPALAPFNLTEQRADPFWFRGVNLQVEMRRMLTLPAFEGVVEPALRIRYTARGGTSGRAFCRDSVIRPDERRIVISIGPGSTVAGALEVLLHEVTHIALPASEMHSDRFILKLVRAAAELWGVRVRRPLDTIAAGVKRAYRVDSKIRQKLARKIAKGYSPVPVRERRFAACPELEAMPEPPAPKPPVPVEERRAKLLDRREQHAQAMLAQWTKRAARAERLVKKWTAKVRYYEKRRGTVAS